MNVGHTSVPEAAEQAMDAFDAMRLRWMNMLTGGPMPDASDPDIAVKLSDLAEDAEAYWTAMDRSRARTCIWRRYADLDHSESVNEAYRRLRTMALAAKTRGCSLYGIAELKEAIVDALDWLYEHCYNAGRARSYPNWWHWQIGIPLSLNDIAVLLYDEIGEERLTRWMATVDHYMPGVGMTGANRAWSALIVGLRAVIGKDAAKAAEARDGLSGEGIFPYVRRGDGFYEDGSFVQHGSFAYTGGYGHSILRMTADLMALLDGTPWEVTDPAQANVWRWVYDAYRPLIFRGAMMDMVRGREISREEFQDHDVGHIVIASVIRLSQLAPAEHRLAFRRIAKRWLLEDSFRSFAEYATIEMVGLARAIVDDPQLAPAEPLELYRQYAGMDRAVLQRPQFAFGIAMHSARIQTYEHMNGTENLRGWYTGAGATYLYNGDLAQYSEDYWPTVDSNRLAGTTVASGLGLAEELGTRDWVGGVSLLGRYGACGMDVAYGAYTLTGRKSWFLFDDLVVALGAGIASDADARIETIIDNRKLGEPEAQPLTVDGKARCESPGIRESASGARWLHLEGSGAAGEGIGYYMPEGATLELLREARSGSWRDINLRRRTSDRAAVRTYQTIWIDHGRQPSGARYSYAVLPGRTAAETAAYAAQPTIAILANSDAVQAVEETRDGARLVGANFWSAGSMTVDMLTTSGPASVMYRLTGDGQLAVAVSDPTQLREERIEIELECAASSCTADPGIVVHRLGPSIRFAVDVSGARGRSFQASFRLEGAGRA